MDGKAAADGSYEYHVRKVVFVLSSELSPGIAMNALAHMAISIGHYSEDHMGRSVLHDATGVAHRGLCRYPVIVLRAPRNGVTRAVRLARAETSLVVVEFTQQMLLTGHDDELAASIASVASDAVEYLGVGLYGPSALVDSICGRYSLWR